MIRGMYESAANMMSSMTRMIRLGNNLANVNTMGYKQDLSAPRAFREMILQRLTAGEGSQPVGSLVSVVVSDQGVLDLSQGAVRQTDRPLDVAMIGSGFFTVQKDGNTYYTRNGTFAVNAEGLLVTTDGGLVQGSGGNVSVGTGDLTVEQDGTVLVNGVRTDQLALADFPEGTPLRKIGNSYITVDDGTPPELASSVGLMQGFLEGSNVNVANSMMELLTSRKSYASSQRVLQLADGALQKAVTELGRV